MLLILSIALSAQTETKHDHDTDHHEHHKNEIGIANAPVYFIKEKIITYGLHIHYVRNLMGSKFGVGLGYEKIFDEHRHQTFGLVGTYRPVDRLSVNISPGLTFERQSKSPNFALHLEMSYEYEYKNFHIGPAFEIAYDPEDYHISIGIHVGYGF